MHSDSALDGQFKTLTFTLKKEVLLSHHISADAAMRFMGPSCEQIYWPFSPKWVNKRKRSYYSL